MFGGGGGGGTNPHDDDKGKGCESDNKTKNDGGGGASSSGHGGSNTSMGPPKTPTPAAPSDGEEENLLSLLEGLSSQELFHWSQPATSTTTAPTTAPAKHDTTNLPPPPPLASSYVRSTVCELELDVHVCDILNPQLLPRGRGLDSQRSKVKDGEEEKRKGQPLAYVPSLLEIWDEERSRRSENEAEEISMADLCLTAESDQVASQRASAFIDARKALKELYNMGKREEKLSQESSVASSSQDSIKTPRQQGDDDRAPLLSQVSAYPSGKAPQKEAGGGMSSRSSPSTSQSSQEAQAAKPPTTTTQFSQAQVSICKSIHLHCSDTCRTMDTRRTRREMGAYQMSALWSYHFTD